MQVKMVAKVRSVTHHEPLGIPGHPEGIDVLMVPVSDRHGRIEAAEKFHLHAQPNGKLEFHVTNPAVAEWLAPGRRFVVTISEECEDIPA